MVSGLVSRPFYMLAFLLWWLSSSSRTRTRTTITLALSIGTPPKQQKQQQQHQQQIDRRKSPALWRLLYQEDEYEGDGQQHVMECGRRPLLRKPEIMSPAGGWSQLEAAVANGADAVYLGLQAFSARARAQNFHVTDDLPRAVEYCHQYQVHVYVALNTLVFDDELEELSRLVQLCHKAKVDAVIVQDLGLCKLIREIQPDLAIHSSTQQSITSADGVDFCRDQHGATRVVLGRELSVQEIAHVSQRTRVEIETFVHGALCVSYSGQCFSSEAWGGRSANRGQCAQACRLPYGLVVDGTLLDSKATENLPYVLSPQDLCGLDQVPALVRAGVACLKIEGRLKDATYVAATTRAYRNAVDQAWEHLHGGGGNNNKKALSLDETVSRLELTQLFSRGQDEVYTGLTSGFLEGTKHQTVVRGRSPRHRGVHVGRVVQGSSPDFGLVVELDPHDDDDPARQLKLGDGIVIDRGLAQEEELGGPIFTAETIVDSKNAVVVQFGRDVMRKWKQNDNPNKKKKQQQYSDTNHTSPFAPVGAHVWKTHDAVIDKKFRRLSQALPPRKWVQIRVRGAVGEPMQIFISDAPTTGRVFMGQTEAVLQPAQTKAISTSQIRKAIGTLGDTDFAIQGDIDFSEFQEDSVWCPMSLIKQARRMAVEQLQAKLPNANVPSGHKVTSNNEGIIEGAPKRFLDKWIKAEIEKDTDRWIKAGLEQGASGNPGKVLRTQEEETLGKGHFSILCRNLEQVDAICSMLEEEETGQFDCKEFHLAEIVVDFLEVEGMKDAVDRIRSVPRNVSVVVAGPRIIKPEEGGIWKALLSLEPDALLVRSTGLLHRMRSMGGEGAMVNVEKSMDTCSDVGDNHQHWVRIPKLIGDFSLNAANALTASELLSYGLERITTSYDLNANAIANMGNLLGPSSLVSRLEVVAHCKMPIFHTEHCVFARFLTRGDSFLNCGHICTRVNTLHLRDESGKDNLVLADMGCRNTVFAAESQSGIHSLARWKQVGIRNFRIELVDERPYEARKIVRTYASVWKGEMNASDAWGILQDIIGGVTLGSFKNTKERRAGELSTD